MKTLKNKIVLQAIKLGFNFEDIDNDITIDELLQELTDFFSENREKLPQIEDECEVDSFGTSQNVVYGDYACSGEIVDFSAHWHKNPDTKVFHSDCIVEENGEMVNVNLFYLVGETDYNAPDGFWYNPKTKSHELFEI